MKHMKKRLLALALTLVMVFSMFGASLSASAAASAWTNAYTAKVDLAASFTAPTNAASITTLKGEATTELGKINAVGPTGKIYAIDYDAAKFSAYVSALTAVAGLTASDDAALVTVAANAKAALDSAKNALAGALITGIYGVTGDRAAVLAQYSAIYPIVANMNVADYADGTIYTAASVTALKTAFTAVDANAATPTSILQYRLAAYTAVTSNLVIADTSAALTSLSADVATAALILANRGDYAASALVDTKFATLAAKYDAANTALYSSTATNSALAAAEGQLEAAIAALAYDKIAGDKTALKALVAEAKALQAEGYTATGFAAAITAAETIVNGYGIATQSEINAAYNALNVQIGLLTIVDAPASKKMELQEAIDAAKALVETDYYPSTWTAFAKKLDETVALAAKPKLTAGTITSAITALTNAKTGLVAKSISLYEMTTLINSCNTTTGLLNAANKANKTQAQIAALEKAVADANTYVTSGVKVQSKLDAAVAALKTAIDNYKNSKAAEAFEGWTYTKGAGWSYYVAGEAATGWIFDEDYDAWYYMDEEGVMAENEWIKIDGTWYWLKSGGAMAESQWARIGGKWYYFKASGAMVSGGWMEIGGVWYYFYESGAMAANTTINGYKVNASGAWVK